VLLNERGGGSRQPQERHEAIQRGFDALALVHALILRLQALVLPFKALVFSSH
jgi:hypothetical protein